MLAAPAAAASPIHAAAQAAPTLEVEVRGERRTAFVRAPAALRGPCPLVLGFHGGAGNAQGYIANSALFAKGPAAGAIVVCPQGTPIALRLPGDHRIWNSGPEYGRASNDVDDVAFTRRLIEAASQRYPVDRKRVFVTGFSNGAQMAYRLALELADQVAAIAPMSGGRLAGAERPARPVPVLHFHGTADTVYPLRGGLGADSIGRAPHAGIDDVIDEWRRFDGADPQATIEPHDGWAAHIHKGPAPVSLILVDGMGHQIAGGGDDHLPGQPMRAEPDAIAMALRFFGDHPMT
ncbi:MAG TPA: PHB depolymerase family esterase [Caulobacteraceae bacterium]|nr:PHB depolymerase family esterase [Caulobacteraceae bacterium]